MFLCAVDIVRSFCFNTNQSPIYCTQFYTRRDTYLFILSVLNRTNALAVVPDCMYRKMEEISIHNRFGASDVLNQKDILVSIMDLLPVKDILQCSLVSKYWNCVANDPRLWKESRGCSKMHQC